MTTTSSTLNTEELHADDNLNPNISESAAAPSFVKQIEVRIEQSERKIFHTVNGSYEQL